MRLFIVATAATVWAGTALADGWKEIEYSQFGFAVSFPGDPVEQTAPYKAADGSTANQTTYSVHDATGLYAVTVIDFGDAAINETIATDQAVNVLRDKGSVLLDIPARVNRHRGRQLSITGNDGSHSTAAIFFADRKLYEIEATVLGGSGDSNTGNAIRFQQSLRFIGDGFGRGDGQRFAGRRFRGGGRFGRRRFQQNPDAPMPDAAPALPQDAAPPAPNG